MVSGPSPFKRNTPSSKAGNAKGASSAQAAPSDVKDIANKLLEDEIEGELHEASEETEEKSSDILKSIVKSLSDDNKNQ